MHKAKCLSREGSGNTRHIVAAKAVEHTRQRRCLRCGGGGSAQGRGGVLVTEAVGTQGKSSVLAVKAVEAQSNGSVSPRSA